MVHLNFTTLSISLIFLFLGSIYVVADWPACNADPSTSQSYCCPASASTPHASCMFQVVFDNNGCADVIKEIEQRVEGQYQLWSDPHKNGTYAFTSSPKWNFLQLSHVSHDKSSTDLIALGFSDTGYSGCTMLGCSTGQNKALHDQGTSFCNVYDLYCQDVQCHPFTPMSIKSQTVTGCTDVSDVSVAPSTCFI